jgi:hypothetical protein
MKMARIIEGDIYKARLLAKEILDAAEKQRTLRLREAQDLAIQVEQDAVFEGIQVAHREVVQESIAIFQERHRLVVDAEAELRALSAEIAQKIIGESQKLSQEQQRVFIAAAVLEIAQKRRLCIQFSKGRLSTLDTSLTMGIDLEEVCDIEPGQVRVITDVGAIMCAELTVISSLQKNQHDS